MRCFDSEPGRLVANQMRRDADLEENDNVQIILDPYNDRRGGFYFSTNPLGARQDLLLTDEGRTRNQAWDSVWRSRARVDSLGWSAEVAIPFDQLRYPDSDEAVWGINIGRAIRRKNEEVFLVPPPQSYGFWGRYRTSRLAVLKGLGRLRSRPPMAVVPYLLSGARRDFTADDPNEYALDPGLDFKYGLTPSLTLDLSWKTDFAQVEADQEQVNLTRFSLFFPEKRDFFLEGAGIFEFGERVERQGLGGPPPTLLFYSRRIGIEEGHNLPVLAGGKLTGRAGPYQVGALRMTTQAMTFVDEEEEDRFLTDGGDLLDEEQAELSGEVIVDTLRVDVLDTLDVARTDFTLLRLRRDLPGSSNVGLIAIDKQPGSDAGYNRTAGMDFSLSLLQASLNLRGFAAGTWSPAAEGGDGAGLLELDYRRGRFRTSVSYLDVEEDFSPEVGFVPRTGIRRIKGDGRYRPRPDVGWIRQFSLGPWFTYLTDRDNTLQSGEAGLLAFVNLEAGDWVGGATAGATSIWKRRSKYGRARKSPRTPTSSAAGISTSSPARTAIFRAFSPWSGAAFSTAPAAAFPPARSGATSSAWSSRGTTRSTASTCPTAPSTPTCSGSASCIPSPRKCSCAASCSGTAPASWWGGTSSYNYRFLPGSDLFVVYNQVWDTEGGLQQADRSLQVKVSWFWKR